MNRQALAFLTLFSLILMLSVYYVTLPPDTTTVIKPQDDTEQDTSKQPDNEEKDKEETDKNEDPKETDETEVITNEAANTLKQEIAKRKDDKINEQSDVVGSPEASEDEKQKALETIESLKNMKTLEEKLVKALSDNKYTSAVEIAEGTCKITIFDQTTDKALAKKIITIANNEIGNAYLIEVSFK